MDKCQKHDVECEKPDANEDSLYNSVHVQWPETDPAKLPRLVLNSCAQAILLTWPPKVLGLQEKGALALLSSGQRCLSLGIRSVRRRHLLGSRPLSPTCILAGCADWPCLHRRRAGLNNKAVEAEHSFQASVSESVVSCSQRNRLPVSESVVSCSQRNRLQLDRSAREVELGLEYGSPTMNLAGQSLKFENGQWIAAFGVHCRIPLNGEGTG
ncbi:protein chibby homolog 1 isoform X1 [Chlorocebus sabaeus]|uniref:protein chibby homolog 1 isoform X1 n=1 Tax=Chlorocebus sabaeus TaxID=60711 RepID=UPI003BF9A071